MTLQQIKHSWHVAGTSVHGAVHQREGRPNHDAIDWRIGEHTGTPLALALADGLGNTQSFRSSIGAALAVEVTLSEFFRFASEAEALDFDTIRCIAEEQLPRLIVDGWRAAVENDLRDRPLTGDPQLQRVFEQEGSAAGQAVLDNQYLSYGATLLAVLVTEMFVMYVQLGDGDMIGVDESGASFRPIPFVKRRANADATATLATPGVWEEVRVRVAPIDQDPPLLIILSNDEYAHSFVSDAEFLKTGQYYLDLVRANGLGSVQRGLTRTLAHNSQQGIGDDMTVGIIKRLEDSDWDVQDRLIRDANTHLRRLQDQIEAHDAGLRTTHQQLQHALEHKASIAELHLALEAQNRARLELQSRLLKALEDEAQTREALQSQLLKALEAKSEQTELQQLLLGEADAREALKQELLAAFDTRVSQDELQQERAAALKAQEDASADMQKLAAESAERDKHVTQLIELIERTKIEGWSVVAKNLQLISTISLVLAFVALIVAIAALMS
jgi:hypothetical protein